MPQLLAQFFNHLGLYAGRTEQRVDLTALQLLGRIGVVQVDLLDQLFVQAISRQNLFGVLLRAGFFLANADGLACSFSTVLMPESARTTIWHSS